MALKIRLRQQGRNNRQTYRLVVADIRSPRDGKYIEMLGWYNPFQATQNFEVKAERINHWLNQGAQISDQVQTILAKAAPDVFKELQDKRSAKRTKLAAKRRALKIAKKK
jgi:small subunit ribosomal protein S16